MKAITVVSGQPGQVQVSELPDPAPEAGTLLGQRRLLGICGTDVDIVENGYGWPPPGQGRPVIGHESPDAVAGAPAGSGFTAGELITGNVSRLDPVPCVPCGHGEWDFCRNGRYTERGSKELGGYAAQLWRIAPEYAIRLDPAARRRVARAGVGAGQSVGTGRADLHPHLLAVPDRADHRCRADGLFAALLGGQRGLQAHVLDRNDAEPKAKLVTGPGANFHAGDVKDIGITVGLTA